MLPTAWLDALAGYTTEGWTALQSFISWQDEIIKSLGTPASFSEMAPRLVAVMTNGMLAKVSPLCVVILQLFETVVLFLGKTRIILKHTTVKVKRLGDWKESAAHNFIF